MEHGSRRGPGGIPHALTSGMDRPLSSLGDRVDDGDLGVMVIPSYGTTMGYVVTGGVWHFL
jgi:hypothetical protein